MVAAVKGDKPADADPAALRKELADKQRELSYAMAEREMGEIDRQVQAMNSEAALPRTADELDDAMRELQVFRDEVRPRELDQRRISLERSVHRADHAKDELGELTAMYDADEFAKTTKELVLKRGRRELEMAELSLAIERSEIGHFEKHELPKRERELQRKIDDARQARRKAELEADKQKLEAALARRKADDRIVKLRDEIAELEAKLDKVQQ